MPRCGSRNGKVLAAATDGENFEGTDMYVELADRLRMAGEIEDILRA